MEDRIKQDRLPDEAPESLDAFLGELADAQLDMFTTVFVGCSETRVLNGRMVTDRGYQTH